MTGKFARRDEEIAIIELAPEKEDQIPPGGPICLQSLSPDRLILICEALAKSVVLARHEREVASVFDTTEPVARELAQSGRMRGSRRSILQNIGGALLVRHRVSGPVEVEEKPDVLWDKPHLERLYARLEDEYELKERAESLNRKLAVIAESAQVLTDIIDTRRSLRFEVIIVLLILFGPVLMLALFSFNDSSIISLPWEGFTTHWYEDAWANQQARDAVVNSLVVASGVTVVSLVFGTAAAWGLTRLRFRTRGAIAGLHGSVLVVPWLIIGVAGLIFFSELGVTLSLQTIGLMHLVVTFPLVVAIISAGLVRFSRSLEEAAIDLGASQLQMMRHVVLPHIAPSLAAAGIFAFAWSFNNFEISFFLGGFEQTFPVWVFSILRQSENLPLVKGAARKDGKRPTLAVERKLLRRCYHTLRELGDAALAPPNPIGQAA